MTDLERARRWRLVLGRYSREQLGGAGLSGSETQVDQLLGRLYDDTYDRRGHRGGQGRARGRSGSGGSDDPASLTAVTWLARSRELFPAATFDRLQARAVGAFGLDEMLKDPATASSLTPSAELGAALLTMRGTLSRDLEGQLREVIGRVVEDILSRIRFAFAQAVRGRRDRFSASPIAVASNFDWRRTIAANLRNVDPETGRMTIDRPRFHSATRRTWEWDVIICIDQSGSMASSVLHSAVCASILASLPGVSVKIVLFSTSVVDVSHLASDPVELLMTAQLGGGTDIARALAYCESLVTRPRHTVVALLSDFEEGGSVTHLLGTVARLHASGVTLLGMAALDEAAEGVYDTAMARRLADRGMDVAAFTPEQFGQWLGEVLG
ncbi:VWA containing CoxE family protein [Serinibacter arcticus]|uniref:VWA containing CoxE family protein n=1 Tax=Serinibacter arcticus TaxID=1655435 RepID=A0A2U2A021_9MICO|nr:VWA containing CoxE family protein [Serinibacter arcticus]